ncbi:MAG: ATP synthase F1 subunit delta [Chloroflexi bacterium]|nr:ATP synthase F1 subunit delta [Chloroflexota bacterium]
MAVAGVARRYAQAVFDIARQDGAIDQWLADTEMIARVVADSTLSAFLGNPKVDFATKQQMLGRRMDAAVQPKALNLLYLLVARRRLDVLADIRAALQDLVNADRQIVTAEVTTAVPLDDALALNVRRQLEEHTGKRVVLRAKVDPAIIGGMIVKVGDKVLDGSTRTRLVELRRNLVGAER